MAYVINPDQEPRKEDRDEIPGGINEQAGKAEALFQPPFAQSVDILGLLFL
jgi:hypothetical protein